MSRIFFLFFLLLPSYAVQAQEMYQTLKGSIEIRGKQGNGEGIIAHSDQLTMRVDHETGTVYMNLDQSTLRTGIDSIDEKLASRHVDLVRFKGQLARGGFDPNYCYSASPLRIEGTMSYHQHSKRISGKGEFKSRFSNARIPCLLEIGFEIRLNEQKWPHFLPGFEEVLRIRILQAILNPKLD